MNKKKTPRIIKNPERNARLRLRRRKPEEWLAAVETIEDQNLRTQVACTIWWDYFGKREVRHAWKHLDGYLAAWNKYICIEPAEHRTALIFCGYTSKLAEERVNERANDEKINRLYRVNRKSGIYSPKTGIHRLRSFDNQP